MLNVELSAIIIRNRSAIGETALTMLAATAANLSAIATVASSGRVVRKGRAIDHDGRTAAKEIVRHNRATFGCATIAATMTAQAGVAEGIPAGSAMRCCQMKRRVGHGNVSKTVDSTAIGFARGLSFVATIAGITTVCDRGFGRGVIDG